MRALVLLLCLTACTTAPERRELERGAGVRPLPARPQPRVGPSFQPHTVPLPPQPNPRPTRFLPQTAEPGIWASSAPEAPWSSGLPVAFGIPLPLLAEDLDAFQSTVHQDIVRRCAFIIREVGTRDVSGINLWARDALDRACFVARMNEHCMAVNRTEVERFEELGPRLSDAFRDVLRRTRVSAIAFADVACRFGESDALKRAIAAAKSGWSKFDGRGNADH